MNILVAVAVLSALIFVHELGHFLVAKWCGVGVLRFSIGFGPALCRWRYAETTYQLSAIPLGGYVRMVGDIPDGISGQQVTDEAVRDGAGEDPQEEDASPEVHAERDQDESEPDSELSEEELVAIGDRSRWFIEKNVWQRSAIVFAGPLFNFIFAAFLVGFNLGVFGEKEVVEKPIIGKVLQGGPADRAGIEPGDEILWMNGERLSAWREMALAIRNGGGAPIPFVLLRAGEQQEVTVRPEPWDLSHLSADSPPIYQIGILQQARHRSVSLSEASMKGVEWTGITTWRVLEGLWGMVAGQVSPAELAGPLFIFGEANRQANRGLESLFLFTAYLSVSLAVLNLLPIPVLDGGHLLFFFLESLFGPLHIRTKEAAQQVGILLLLCLMVFAVWNDLRREPPPDPQQRQWRAAPER